MPPQPRQVGWSTLAHAKAAPDSERKVFVSDMLSDRSSPVWNLADRTRVEELVDQFDTLVMRARQDVYALATISRLLER